MAPWLAWMIGGISGLALLILLIGIFLWWIGKQQKMAEFTGACIDCKKVGHIDDQLGHRIYYCAATNPWVAIDPYKFRTCWEMEEDKDGVREVKKAS